MNLAQSSVYMNPFFSNHISDGRLSIFDPLTNGVRSGPTMSNKGRSHLAMTNIGNGQILACGGGTNTCES